MAPRARPRLLAAAGLGALVAATAGTIAPPGWLCRIEIALAGAALLALAATGGPGARIGARIGRSIRRRGDPLLPRGSAFRAVAVLLASLAAVDGVRRADRAAAWARDGPFRARPPPELAQSDLLVERCGEDPFRNRAWLVGRDAAGRGLLCSWPGRLPDELGAGARVRVRGHVRAPRGPTNPGERDPSARLARDGIVARMYLGERANLQIEEPGGARLTRLLRGVRRRGTERLRRALSPDDAGLAAALAFGWRSGIVPHDRVRFERTGTLHLLAISGLHLLLVAGAVHAVARRAGLPPRAAAAVTLALCLLYVPVAGAGAPVRRAATVLVIYGIALARGRVPDAGSALGGAALLLVLHDPDEVRQAGFWLSFAAAAGIALHAAAWRARWGRRHRLLARFPAVQQDRKWRLRVEAHLLGAVPVSLAAWGATAPLVAWHFGLVTPLAPLTNLVAAPFVTLLMPLLFLVAAGAEILAPVATALFHALRFALDGCGALPGAALSVPPPAAPAVALWYGGFVLARARPRAGALVLGVAALLAWPARPAAPPSLTVLDVGHGQAILLRDRRGRAALVDGGSRNRLRIGMHVLRPALRAHGIAHLDLALCTHADRDHWNGLAELLGRVPIDRLVLGPDAPAPLVREAARRGTAIVTAGSGDTLWRGDGIRLRVLDDGRRVAGATANDRSLVLLVELDGVRVLLPADRETAGTAELLRRDLPRCEVLLAPHHGAPNAMAARLAARTRPRWLVVSTGPSFVDEATLRAYGCERVLRTDRDGSIRIEVRDGVPSFHVGRPAGDTIRPP